MSLVIRHLQLKERSYELEHLDTGDYTAAEYTGCLAELRRINRWLGDARAMRHTILRRIERDDLREFSLLDAGAGSGELLRGIARWAAKKNIDARLIGLELNERATVALKDESQRHANIEAVRADALALPFADKSFDYAMCSLFAHHFREGEIVALLREFGRVARGGVFVIDLHRHLTAYLLYTTAGRIVLHNRLVREDGALSIRRGFRPPELYKLAAQAGLEAVEVERVFPFRLILIARPS
ncbi:MAG: methyltransferase domain-containing protein [Pyrinomonadaceae bacterium MAG19_C2-C3]|nr:methyltransferase domain-containing protein [Pyrinomonadaceae bacterium MAG19_C2-C3]